MNAIAERLKGYLQNELEGREEGKFYLCLANEEDVFVAEVPIQGNQPDMGAVEALSMMMQRTRSFKIEDDTYGCLVFMGNSIVAFTELDGVTKFEIEDNRIQDMPVDMAMPLEEVFPLLLKGMIERIRHEQGNSSS